MPAHPFWSWTGLALTVSASALWGLAPVFTKGALAGFSPELTAVARLTIAAVLCRLLARSEGVVLRDRHLWIAGVALGADFLLYNYGLRRTTAAVAGLLVNIEVISTIALASMILGETIGVRRLTGGMLTLGGVLYLGFDRSAFDADLGHERLLGNVMVMASSICWSVYAVAQRLSTAPSGLFGRLATIFFVAALVVAPSTLHAEAWHIHADARAYAMLAGLSVLCTFAVYWIYAHAQQLIDLSVLAVLLCTMPIFTIVFAYFLLGEAITAQIVIGGILVVSGIAVVATDRGAVN